MEQHISSAASHQQHLISSISTDERESACHGGGAGSEGGGRERWRRRRRRWVVTRSRFNPARRTSIRRADGGRRPLTTMQHRVARAHPGLSRQLARERRHGGPCEQGRGRREASVTPPTLGRLVPSAGASGW
jgi:hypothetical protein